MKTPFITLCELVSHDYNTVLLRPTLSHSLELSKKLERTIRVSCFKQKSDFFFTALCPKLDGLRR